MLPIRCQNWRAASIPVHDQYFYIKCKTHRHQHITGMLENTARMNPSQTRLFFATVICNQWISNRWINTRLRWCEPLDSFLVHHGTSMLTTFSIHRMTDTMQTNDRSTWHTQNQRKIKSMFRHDLVLVVVDVTTSVKCNKSNRCNGSNGSKDIRAYWADRSLRNVRCGALILHSL